MSNPTSRITLRDLPLPAKLVVTTFLISVGLGYLWAMAQIHFKQASHGNPLPTTADLVSRFSGVPWPLEPKPDAQPEQQEEEVGNAAAFKKAAVKIKTIIDTRCAHCHGGVGEKKDTPLTTYDEVAKWTKSERRLAKGKMHAMLQGNRDDWLDNMVDAFFDKSLDWKNLSEEQKKQQEPRRNAERLALIAWIDAGAPKEDYTADRFPLPAGIKAEQLPMKLLTEGDPDAAKANQNAAKPVKEKGAKERWDDAKARQINVERLTQSTHAHLLSFSMLWALTGIIFAFSTYPYRLRCFLSPLVLIVQVVDIACWWLARLESPVGAYFAILIVATGGIVGLGLVAQIMLSLFNMYGKTGRMVLATLCALGIALFALTYVSVIKPQLERELQEVQQAK